MKKTVLFITALLLMGSTAGAQGLLGRLGERAKNAVEENIGNKVEQGVNDILNGKKKDKKNNKGTCDAAGCHRVCQDRFCPGR